MKAHQNASASIRSISMKLVLSMSLFSAVVGCFSDSNPSWTEDVKLPDGRVVTLSRYVEFKAGGSQFGDPSTESLIRFEFKHPSSGELVRWESTKQQKLQWTIALWLDNGKPMLLTEPAYGGESFAYGCPNPPYLLYEHVEGKWRSRPLVDVDLERIRSNLTANPLVKRSEIKSNRHRLSAEDTSNSYAFREGVFRVPYVLDFKDMPPQTFETRNCDRLANQLLAK